jgi:hypothetical protein
MGKKRPKCFFCGERGQTKRVEFKEGRWAHEECLEKVNRFRKDLKGRKVITIEENGKTYFKLEK